MGSNPDKEDQPVALDDDVATWLRDEHHIVKRLIDQLCNHLGIGAAHNHSREWLGDLRAYFARLRVHMNRHFRMEEEGGFMQPVLERRPTLTREVEHLKHEHVELSQMLDQILEELTGLTVDDRLLIEDACIRVQHLASALRHHEEHEEMLVSAAFTLDIGTKD